MGAEPEYGCGLRCVGWGAAARGGVRHVVAVTLTALMLAACGGGGGGGGASTPAEPPTNNPPPPTTLALPTAAPGTETLVRIQSAAGDSVGGGTSRTYTLANAGISVEVVGATLRVFVRGDDHWEAWIRTDATGPVVREGLHTGLRQNTMGIDNAVGADWRRETQRCVNADASLAVDRARYLDSRLVEVDLRFVQRCDGETAPLQIQVRWVAGETPVRAAAPPVPAGLWQPPVGVGTATGNVIYIESAGAEPVFAGRSLTFTDDNAVLNVAAAGNRIDMDVRGGDIWLARLRSIDRPGGFQAGYYDGLRGFDNRYNPARGALEWYRGTARCASPRGWLAVDRIVYLRGALTALELRFEQRCQEPSGVVRGWVRWQADQVRLPPAPAAAPAGLWAAPANAVPVQGNHLLLVTEPGAGMARLLTSSDTDFTVYDDAGTLRARFVERQSGASRSATFRSRYTAARLEPGYRGNLGGYIDNPALGSLRFDGDGLGCSPGSGWYVVDEVSHRHGVLRSVSLRFEQRCETSNALLRGSLRWASSDPAILEGPADPLPSEPMLAPAPTMPTTGSALLLQSRGLDFVGRGRDWLYTAQTTVLYAGRASVGPSYVFSAQGEGTWLGTLWPPEGQSRLVAGRFDIAGRIPRIPTGYAFSVSGLGRTCEETSGWFEIDRVDYDGEQLSLLELHFEQYCDGSPYPLLGRLRWRAGEATQHAQPEPVPPGLWAPLASALPSRGNFSYLQSNPGGFVGNGESALAQPEPSRFLFFQGPGTLRFDFDGYPGPVMMFNFAAPRGQDRLLPGYYSQITRTAVGHPLKMAADLTVDSRACDVVDGWLAIDDIAYDALGLQRISLRMMQVCDGMGPPAFAALRWAR